MVCFISEGDLFLTLHWISGGVLQEAYVPSILDQRCALPWLSPSHAVVWFSPHAPSSALSESCHLILFCPECHPLLDSLNARYSFSFELHPFFFFLHFFHPIFKSPLLSSLRRQLEVLCISCLLFPYGSWYIGLAEQFRFSCYRKRHDTAYRKAWMNFLANPIELLHQLEILSSIFKENFKMFFTVVEAVYIPTNTIRVILTLWSYWGPGVLILTLVTYCLSGSNSTYLGRKEKFMEEWWQSQSSE